MTPLLNIKQAAARLGIGRNTMAGLLQDNAITHYKIGNRKKVKEQDLEAYIEQFRVEAKT